MTYGAAGPVPIYGGHETIGGHMRHLFFRAGVALTGLICLSACGQVAFRRGSGPDAFAQARAACRQPDQVAAAVRACLEKAGWTVADLNPDPADTPAPAASSAPPAASAASSAPAPAASGLPAAPTGKIAVGGWWKLGGGAADLDAAAGACAAALGPEDQPAPGYHLVTRALYACLSRQGWHGFGRS